MTGPVSIVSTIAMSRGGSSANGSGCCSVDHWM